MDLWSQFSVDSQRKLLTISENAYLGENLKSSEYIFGTYLGDQNFCCDVRVVPPLLTDTFSLEEAQEEEAATAGVMMTVSASI